MTTPFRQTLQIACLSIFAVASSTVFVACSLGNPNDSENAANLGQAQQHPPVTDMAPYLQEGDACDPDSNYAFCGSGLACDRNQYACQKALRIGIGIPSGAAYTDSLLSNNTRLEVTVTLHEYRDIILSYNTTAGGNHVFFFDAADGEYEADMRVRAVPSNGDPVWYIGHTGKFTYKKADAESAYQTAELFPESAQ